MADIIFRFVEKRSLDELEWDDFTSIRHPDPKLDAVRLRCVDIADEFPPDIEGEYCNQQGYAELRRIAEGLRRGRPE